MKPELINSIAKESVKSKEKFEWIKTEILEGVKQARELYEDFYCQGLNVNTIEAEGYLRAFIQLANKITQIEQDVEKYC